MSTCNATQRYHIASTILSVVMLAKSQSSKAKLFYASKYFPLLFPNSVAHHTIPILTVHLSLLIYNMTFYTTLLQ